MRLFFFLFSFVLWASCASMKSVSVIKINTLEGEGNLLGHVMWVSDKGSLSFFDVKGNLVYCRAVQPISHGDPDTVAFLETFFKYNSDGKLIEERGDFLFKQKMKIK